MPQLVKGGKWAFAWVVVGPEGEIVVPPPAWREYGFKVGEQALFMPGSRRSGGFGLSTARLLADSRLGAEFEARLLGRSPIHQEGRLQVPVEVGVRSGQRLLAVRGSGFALGFVARGPIYQEALRQSDRLEQF